MISIWSIFVTIIISNLLVVLFCFLSKKTSYIKMLGIPVLLTLLLMIIVRILIPMEFPYTKVFFSTNLLPKIDTFLRTPLSTVLNLENINLFSIIGAVWFTGIVVSIIRLLRNEHYLKRSFEFCSIKTDIDKDAFLKVAAEDKIPRRLKIIETSAISIPMIFGFISPTIVFPISNFTSEEQYFILKHELKHYHNKDIWVKTLIELICAIYWWNPFVYNLRRRSDSILEMNVDLSLSKTWEETKRLRYLEFLLNTYKKSQLSKRKLIHGTLGIVDSNNQSEIVRRFELLFPHEKLRYSNVRLFIASIVSVVILLFSFSCIVQPQYSLPSDREPDLVALTPDTAYLVKMPDGQYDVYLHNAGYLTTIKGLEEPYKNLPIKEREERK
ncbi:hypothetical protein A7X67_17350 [Clostridium sp. W14A]|nr:hypothetical protein A7X67_17350 [Clostridium sp. W14A]